MKSYCKYYSFLSLVVLLLFGCATEDTNNKKNENDIVETGSATNIGINHATITNAVNIVSAGLSANSEYEIGVVYSVNNIPEDFDASNKYNKKALSKIISNGIFVTTQVSPKHKSSFDNVYV